MSTPAPLSEWELEAVIDDLRATHEGIEFSDRTICPSCPTVGQGFETYPCRKARAIDQLKGLAGLGIPPAKRESL